MVAEEVEDIHPAHPTEFPSHPKWRRIGARNATDEEGTEMAVLMTLEVPGGTTAEYDRTNEMLGIADANDAPPGLVSHVCGTTDDGIVVVDVWDSVTSLDDFARNRLSAALLESGMPPAEPRTSPVHNLLFGAGREANVIVMIELPGFTTEAYDGLVANVPAHVGSGENHPAVLHVAALDGAGNVHVVDLWDSEAAFAEFAESQIAPVAGDAMPPFAPRIVPVYNRLEIAPRATA
jgi:hypothetical protein